MPYCNQTNLVDYLNPSLAGGDWPVKTTVCAFTEGGAGVPGPVLSLLVFGGVGLALSVRVKHPGPLIVAFILTAGITAASAPAGGINILAIVLLAGIAVLGLYLYQQAQDSL